LLSDLNKIRAIILDLMPAWAPDELGQFEFMSGGFSNDNYSFYRITPDQQQKYVLRVPKITQPFVDRSAELKTYRAMPEPIGVKVIAFEENSGCLITQWLNGQVLAETSSDSYNQHDLVDYVRSLHAALPATKREYNVASLVQLLSPSIGTPIPEISPHIPLVSCHNDLNPWNVMVTPDGWKTLDWEFFGLNDPLFDLVALHQGLELPDSLLSGLAAEFLREDDEPRLLDNLRRFWLRELAWADYQMQAGNDRDEIQQQQTLAREKLALV
tara:strand:+ start:49 stop:858 length:810 start_codon:yes stop_codon:yes gene_type:complete